MVKTILIADDEVEICIYLKKMLSRRGCAVSTATDGLEADRLLRTERFDAVLLDCSMPGLTGPELINVVKQNNPDTKVIIFSGFSAVDGRLAKDLGADGFLEKPLNINKIEEMLEIK